MSASSPGSTKPDSTKQVATKQVTAEPVTTKPIIPPERLDPRRRPRASKVASPWQSLALCLASLAAMAPWPLLGILLMRSLFDEALEAFLLFGGLTLFPLMILALFGASREELLIVLIMLVWLAAAVVPDLLLRRRLTSWWAIGGLLAGQAAFSFAQAVMGILLIVGKSV